MKLPLNYELVSSYDDSVVLAIFNSCHPEPYVVWKVNCGVLFDGVYFSNPKEALRYFSELINKNGDFDNTPINKPYVEGDSFPERLKFLRKERGLTQEQLAKELSISYSSFRSYELGTKRPNCKALLALENFFNVRGSDLISNDVITKKFIDLSVDEIKKQNFSNKLKYFRNKKNLTQKKLAKDIGISIGTIRNYECNKRHPTGDILLKLAKVLDVSAEILWINSRN